MRLNRNKKKIVGGATEVEDVVKSTVEGRINKNIEGGAGGQYKLVKRDNEYKLMKNNVEIKNDEFKKIINDEINSQTANIRNFSAINYLETVFGLPIGGENAITSKNISIEAYKFLHNYVSEKFNATDNKGKVSILSYKGKKIPDGKEFYLIQKDDNSNKIDLDLDRDGKINKDNNYVILYGGENLNSYNEVLTQAMHKSTNGQFLNDVIKKDIFNYETFRKWNDIIVQFNRHLSNSKALNKEISDYLKANPVDKNTNDNNDNDGGIDLLKIYEDRIRELERKLERKSEENESMEIDMVNNIKTESRYKHNGAEYTLTDGNPEVKVNEDKNEYNIIVKRKNSN